MRFLRLLVAGAFPALGMFLNSSTFEIRVWWWWQAALVRKHVLWIPTLEHLGSGHSHFAGEGFRHGSINGGTTLLLFVQFSHQMALPRRAAQQLSRS